MTVLKGKVAVITGGTRGFGLAVARAYAREGAHVIVGSRSQQSVDSAVQELQAGGAEASGVMVDVSEQDQVQALADHALDLYERFDIWINNAGLSAPYGPTVHIEPARFLETIQTNIIGTYYGSITAMRHFLPREEGKLINILGRGDRGKPVPMQNAYAASKAWVKSFTQALADEYKDRGVGVFALNPGMMETDMLEKVQVVAGYENRLNVMDTILRMWAVPPSTPAEKAVWLASAETDGRTGLEVRQMTPWFMLAGLLGELFRRLTGAQPEDTRVEFTRVQPEIPVVES